MRATAILLLLPLAPAAMAFPPQAPLPPQRPLAPEVKAPSACVTHACVCGCLEGGPCVCGNARRADTTVRRIIAPVIIHQPATYGQPLFLQPPPAAIIHRPAYAPPPALLRSPPPVVRGAVHCPS